jgi:uncharacterized protein (TIGR03790 family)
MIDRVARLGLPLSITIALAADFPWGDFQGHTHWHNVGWIPFVSPPVRPGDIALNLLLFLPLGVFAARRVRAPGSALAHSALIAFVVSVIGEWTQVYSHTRFPSATDVACNVGGALLGTALVVYARRTSTSRTVKAVLHLGLLVGGFLGFTPAETRAQGPESVALVINDQSAASRRVGDYYARKRAIPASNIIHIWVADSETIDRGRYNGLIERPIAEALTRQGLQDRILYLVLAKGIPLRITGSTGQSGTVSSVDSELTLLYRRMTGETTPIAGWIPNPYFLGSRPIRDAEAFTHRRFDIYLVTRLDAFTMEEALALVDKALTPSREGKIVLDEKSTLIDRGGDAWLRASASELETLGQGDRVALEATRKVATDISPVLGYYSWGSNDPANRLRRLHLGFVPGAIAGTFVSSDGRTFNEPPAGWAPGDDRSKSFAGTPQSLIGDLLREGATGAAGHVAEPFLEGTVRPQILFPAYVSGFNLVESFYLAIPYLSWQTIVIGDPLCAPFPRKVHANIDNGADAATELPALFAVRRLTNARRIMPRARPETIALVIRAETRLARGNATGAREALEQATAADQTLAGAELQLALLYEQAALFDAAAERYRRVLALAPENVVALNNLAYMLAVHRKLPSEGLPLAKKAHAVAPSSAPVTDTLAWIEHLVGHDNIAGTLLADAVRRAPRNAQIRLHAAIVYAASGQSGNAAAALKAALVLDPALEKQEDVRRLKGRLTSGSK